MGSVLKLKKRLLGLCVCLLWLANGLNTYGGQPNLDSCHLVVEALRAVNELKPGMPRADLEKNFVLDGGISFPSSGTYTFKKCHYIKIDVGFEAHDLDKGTQSLSRTDAIVTISKPYLAYPIAD